MAVTNKNQLRKKQEEEEKKTADAAKSAPEEQAYAQVKGPSAPTVEKTDKGATAHIGPTNRPFTQDQSFKLNQRKAVRETPYEIVETGKIGQLPEVLEPHREMLQRKNDVGDLMASSVHPWAQNKIKVDPSKITSETQLFYFGSTLADKASVEALYKDYAKRNGLKVDGLYRRAEMALGKNAFHNQASMSRSGRLKEIGLMTLDGEDIDFDTAGPDTIVQAIRDIADGDLQKEAIKLWQAETRDKDSRFYGYNAYNLDYSFRDSALLTQKDYKAYANGLSGKFDPSESALEKSLRTYAAEYTKLEAKGKYVMRQELPVLQKAFAQQMGLQSAPDIAQVRRALEEADKAKAAQKEAAKEPGLPEKVLGSLSEWWNGLGKGGKENAQAAAEASPAQEEATTKAKPRVEGQAPFFGRAPQNSAGNAGQENTAAMAEAPTAAKPKVDFRGPLQGGTYGAQTGETQSEDTEGTVKTQPKVEGQAPFFGGKGLQTEQPEIPVPPGYGGEQVEPGQQAVSGTVNMRDDPIGAITKYVIKGQGGLLDDETDAAVEEFALSSPEMMALFGILSEEDAKAIDTGNHAFNVVIQNTGLLGPLARHAQKINSRGYLNDLKDDAAALLISLVDDAAHMKLTDEETADIEAGLTNRVTLFCEKHPDRLTELNAAMALSDEMNLAALGEKDTSAQEALDSARKRCRSGYATKADWELVYANAPVTTSAQKRGDGAYNQAVGGFQQLLDESYMTDSTDNWYNAQTLLYLHENGAYPDLSGKEAILYKNELQSYLWEAAGAEYDKAYALGYESLGGYWKSTGTGSMADLQQQALTLREADLKAMSEAPEEPEYKGDGSASTATAVIAGIATGMNELAAENYTALATMGAITDTDYDRQRVHAYYYGTGSFCDAEARCKADLYGMVEEGYFPDEAVAGYVKGYLDNGGVALDLGIMPTEYGWEVADRANEAKQRVQDTTAWAREYLTASQGRAFGMAANASNNTVRMAESFLLSAPLVYTGASGFGKFLAGTMNMMAAYGAPAYLEGVETALSGGADLKGANVMGTSVAFAQAQAEMFTDYGIVGDLLRATGTKELIGEGLEQAGMTAARRLWYAAKAGLKQTAEVVAEEVTKDEFFEGTFTGAAEAGTWKAIELTNGFTQMPSPSGLLKIAGASLEGGLESVGPVTRELIANIGENTIMTLPIALISGGIAGAGDWRSTRDVRRAAQTGKAEDVAQAGRSIVEDMGDPAKASAVDAAAQEAHLSRIASDILLRDEGETGTVAAQARAVREQADSHQKTYTKSFKANRAAQSAMAEAQAKLDAGDTSEETLQALKDAQEAFAKTRNNMDESWREYQQKKAESDSLHERALTMARDEAQKQVQQERAELAGKVKAESDIRQYETLTGDDTIRKVNLEENMRATGFANKREEFADAIDSWDGEQKGLEFVVGRVSEPLKSVGVQDAEIVLSSDKLAKIKKDHPAMSDEVIRQLPEVLEKPVVVMKSRTVNGRLTMFGEVMDDAGEPVLAVVSLDPQKNLVAGANFIRLNSAYGKNTYPQEFINKSEILYVDKKRAADWAVSTGLQLPVDLTPVRDSSANIVPQNQKNDNPDIEADYRGVDGEVLQPTPTAGRARRNPVQTLKRLSRDLGIGQAMGTKKMNNLPNGVAGYYQRGAQYLATRNNFGSSVEVTAHEIGHAVADRLGITGTDRMVGNLSRRFTANYQPDQLPGEAFAEFFWRYMVSDEAARDFAGDAFVADMERRLRQERMLKPVQKAQREIRRYLNAAADEKIRLMIRDRSDKNRDLTIDERFADAERKFVTEFVDSTRPAEDVNDEIRAQTGENRVDERMNLRHSALMQSTAPRRAWNLLTRNLTDADGTIIGDSLKTRLKKTGIRGKDFGLLNEYMLAKHSLSRDVHDKPVFDRQSITGKDTREFIRETERNHPEVVAAAKAFQEFRHDFMTAYMVNTGYLEEDTLYLFETMYPDYVPTYRVKDRGGRGAGGQTYQIRRASGSTEEIVNPMDSFVEMVNTIVAMNLRNETAKTWDSVYRQYEGMGIFGREVTEDQRLMIMNMEDVQDSVRKILEEASSEEDVIDKVLNRIGEKQVRKINTGDVNLPNIVSVQLPNGERRFYEMFDQELFDMLSGTEDSGRSAFEIFGKLTRTMSALTTGSNPVFAVRNLMRDYQNSVNYGSWASNYAQGAYRWLHAAYNVWKENGGYEQYAALGGGGWTRINPQNKRSAEEYRGELFGGYNTSNAGRAGRWAGRKIWNTVTAARLNEIVEQASRFAEYKYGKHDLTTPEGRQEAYLAAQDVTTDFGRRGSSSKVRDLRMIFPFLNASLQGVYRVGRQVTKAEADRAPTRFIKTVINTGIASALASGLLLRHLDDDEKEEFLWLSDDLKAKHMYLPNFAPDVLGDAPLIRIPLAQDPLSYAVHAAVTNTMWSGQGEEWAVALSAVADNILNTMNPINSTVLDPLISMSTNKNWYGSNIVPRSMDGWYVTNQYAETTPTAFVAASNFLDGFGVGVSPMMLQYLAEQYTGYIGQMAIPFFSRNEHTGEIEGVSAVIEKVRKTLTSDPLISQQVISSVYDNAELLTSVTKAGDNDRPMDMLRSGLTQYEASAAYEEAHDLMHAGGAIYEAKKFITNGYKRIDEIEANPDLSEDEKYDLTSSIRREMIEMALDANEEMAAFRERYLDGETFLGRFMKGTMMD